MMLRGSSSKSMAVIIIQIVLVLLQSLHVQSISCLDSSNNPVILNYSHLDFGRFLVRTSHPPVSPASCFLRVLDNLGSIMSVISGAPNPACDSPFVFDMESSVPGKFEYDKSYSFELVGYDAQGNTLCTSSSIQLNIPSPAISSMVPSLYRIDGESVSIRFSSPVALGLCEVFLVAYKGVNLSPPSSKKGPCASYFTFMSDNKFVAMRPGDALTITWSYYEDGETVTYMSPSPVSLGSIPSTFSCSQSLAVVREQHEVSHVAITSPTPRQGKCSLVVATCTSGSYPTTVPFTACPQYAILSLASMSLTTSPTTCNVYWQYEYNGVTCKEPQNTISVTIRERCSLTTTPVTVDNTLSVKFVFEATNQMDCIARLFSCGSTTYDPPIEKRFANCISGSSAVTFTSTNDALEIVNGVSCNLDFVRVPSGYISSSAQYSCHSDVVTIRAGPPAPSWVPSAGTQLVYDSNGCVSLSWDEYTTDKVNCYGVSRSDSDSNEWINLHDCVKSRIFKDCVPIDLSVNYQYRVRAFVADRGWTPTYLQSEIFKIGYFLFPSSPELVSPVFANGIESTFATTDFPPLTIMSNDNSKRHVFVAKLVPRSKSDLASGNTVLLPLESGDVGYSGPPPASPTPTFTYTFSADESFPGRYPFATVLYPNPYVPKGKYSLVMYSCQPGGLMGHYYATPMFVDLVDTKYESVDFTGPVQSPVVGWPFGPETIIEQMSIRWTGFIEPKFPEQTVFRIESFGRFKLWIDDVVVIDKFDTPCTSGVCTSAPIQLRPSPWVPQGDLSNQLKLFHSIRLEYVITSDLDTVPTTPDIVLKWSSRSLPLETIPTSHLFAAKSISVFPDNPERFPLVSVVPGPPDYTKSTLMAPVTAAVGAGVSTFLKVQTRDALGQTTERNCFDKFIAEFRLQSNPSITVTARSLNAGGSLCGGLYSIPVTFTVAGDYTVVVTESVTGAVVSGSPDTIMHVVAGPPTVVGGPLTFGPATTISTLSDSRVYFSLLDQFGQPLDGSDLAQPLPHIHVLSEWLFDVFALNRLGGPAYTDNVERAKIPSDIVPGIHWDSLRKKFYGIVRFAQSGTVRVRVRISDDELSMAEGQTVVIGNVGFFDDTKAVVIPPIQPLSSEIVAGTPFKFLVQLRDINMNVLGEFPTQHLDVFVGLTHLDTIRVVASAACSPSLTLGGVFECTPSFDLAGTIVVNITVNGNPTRLIMDQISHPGSIIDGPFSIRVSHSDLDPALTVWSGLPRVLRKDVVHETVLTFFDQFGNDLGDDVREFKNVKLEMLKSSGSVVVFTETNVLFRDGKARLMLLPTVPSPDDPTDPDYLGYSIRLTVAGQVINPIGVPFPVRVIRGGPEADAITCTTTPATQMIAGMTFTTTCVGGGLEGVPSEHLSLHFGNTETVLVSGAGGYTASIGPTVPGIYSVYATLAQRGGLEGRYYMDPDFNTLISPSPAGISSTFTRVDPILDFDFGENIIVENAVAQSVEWSGFIESPVSLTIRFKLLAYGSVRLTLGKMILYDSLLEGGRVDAVIELPLLAGVLNPISLRFRPDSGSTKLSLQWSNQDINGVPTMIPPRALLRNVIIPSSMIDSYPLLPSIISSLSMVSFTSPAVKNGILSFLIDAFDAYGNKLETSSSCLAGGSFPGCLFQITAVPSGAIVGTPTVAHQSGGRYSVHVSVGNVDVFLLHVKLALAGGAFADITSSPFTVDVL